MKKIASGILAVSLSTVLFAPSVFAEEKENKFNFSDSSNKFSYSLLIEKTGKIKMDGVISSISGTTLNVTSWGGVWIVNVASTIFQRKAGGKSNLGEFQIGDLLTIWGTIPQGTTNWTLQATKVRNNSIQMKRGDFQGTISNLNAGAGTFTVTTEKKGVVQVSVNSDTKIYLNNTTSTLSNFLNGMWARVEGIFNRTASTLLAEKVRARSPPTTATTTVQ